MKEVYVVMRKRPWGAFPICVDITREKAVKSIRGLERFATSTKNDHYYIEKVIYWGN